MKIFRLESFWWFDFWRQHGDALLNIDEWTTMECRGLVVKQKGKHL